ncbi:hypothetical protein OAF34_06825 [Pirellulaceae bacterium]|nr:hypothetical protein [Pirellulaceae bacterium]
MNCFRISAILGLAAVVLTTSTSAQDEKKKKRQNGSGQIQSQLMGAFKSVEMSEEQKKKMVEVAKKFSGQILQLRKDTQAILSPEQRKSRQQAMKEAKAAGKKGKEIVDAANASAGIDKEIVAKLKEIQKKSQAIQKEARTALMALLSDEQKAGLPKKGKGNKGQGKKGKGKKKKSDDNS